AQAETLARKLGDNPAAPPNQWVELTNGRYLSEKDPGYPFLAAPFQALGNIRWAPLFYGALACLGLFIGARRWLGRFGGLAAVGLYCSSGAALGFAWRDYMPTFTDASLIAAGSGALLWAVVATDASARRRRPGRIVVRNLGPVVRVHLDGRPDLGHRAGRQVLRSGDRCDLLARRLAGHQDSRPSMASRPDLSRRHHGDVRPGRVVLLRH